MCSNTNGSMPHCPIPAPKWKRIEHCVCTVHNIIYVCDCFACSVCVCGVYTHIPRLYTHSPHTNTIHKPSNVSAFCVTVNNAPNGFIARRTTKIAKREKRKKKKKQQRQQQSFRTDTCSFLLSIIKERTLGGPLKVRKWMNDLRKRDVARQSRQTLKPAQMARQLMNAKELNVNSNAIYCAVATLSARDSASISTIVDFCGCDWLNGPKWAAGIGHCIDFISWMFRFSCASGGRGDRWRRLALLIHLFLILRWMIGDPSSAPSATHAHVYCRWRNERNRVGLQLPTVAREEKEEEEEEWLTSR